MMESDKNEGLALEGVFRYSDLATELQDLILEAAIIVAQENGEKLSRLACVSPKWQQRIESLTFARLGKFDLILGRNREERSTWRWPILEWPNPFRSIHLGDFERIVVGTRRKYVRRIQIEFNSDDQDDVYETEADERPTSSSRDERSRAVRGAPSDGSCRRFGQRMANLFRILHLWDPDQTGPSYLDVKIRITGGYCKWPEAEFSRLDFTQLPLVNVIRSFELIANPYGMKLAALDLQYVPARCINEILQRLPQLHSATINVDLPDALEITPRPGDPSQLVPWNTNVRYGLTARKLSSVRCPAPSERAHDQTPQLT